MVWKFPDFTVGTVDGIVFIEGPEFIDEDRKEIPKITAERINALIEVLKAARAELLSRR